MEVEEVRKKKKNKRIPTERENYNENHVDEIGRNTEKSSKKKHMIEGQEDDVQISKDHGDSLSKKSKKKKKRKHFDLENTESSDEPIHKKVKENTSHDQKKESKIEEVQSNYLDSTKCKKHKKKKHKERLEEDNHLTSGNSDDEKVAKIKKKKKDKKNKTKDKSFIYNHDETEFSDELTNDKKSKKKKKKKIEDNKYDEKMRENSSNGQDDEEVRRKSKKKKKRNNDNSHSDSDTSHNSIKADLNKKDKKKLKHNKDHELSDHIRQKGENGSCRKNDTCTKVETLQTGQWGTAFTENKDKQSKFLRLLGGFKKGGEDQDAKTQKFTSKFANRAMDKTTEENYQKKLEHQYEKAMTTNLQRGIGLGFQQPPDAGKKFYIDKGSSKSIKFDN